MPAQVGAKVGFCEGGRELLSNSAAGIVTSVKSSIEELAKFTTVDVHGLDYSDLSKVELKRQDGMLEAIKSLEKELKKSETFAKAIADPALDKTSAMTAATLFSDGFDAKAAKALLHKAVVYVFSTTALQVLQSKAADQKLPKAAGAAQLVFKHTAFRCSFKITHPFMIIHSVLHSVSQIQFRFIEVHSNVLSLHYISVYFMSFNCNSFRSFTTQDKCVELCGQSGHSRSQGSPVQAV